MFTFHSLVRLLLPVVKLNGVSQPISIEYKVVQGLNQAVFTSRICSGLSYALKHVSDGILHEKMDHLCKATNITQSDLSDMILFKLID